MLVSAHEHQCMPRTLLPMEANFYSTLSVQDRQLDCHFKLCNKYLSMALVEPGSSPAPQLFKAGATCLVHCIKTSGRS